MKKNERELRNKRIVESYPQNSVDEIAERFDLSREMVYLILKEGGKSPSLRVRIPKAAEVVWRLARGQKAGEIASTMNLSLGYVKRIAMSRPIFN